MSKLALIILIQLFYVPMLSLRTICMVKSLRVLTALFGFLEAVIYIFGLAIVLSGDQSILEMVIYAVGFSLGLIVGTLVEEKLAIGYSSFQVNVNHDAPFLIKELRDNGFGVTVFKGTGRDGYRYKLEILAKRKRENELISTILSQEPKAFIMSFEPKMFKGGYLSEIMKKRFMLKRKSYNKPSNDYSVFRKSIIELKDEVAKFKNNWNGRNR